MLALVPSLTSIALLDSLSIIPLCIVFLAVLLAGPSPVVRSFAFIIGVCVTYFGVGVLVLLGLQEIFDEIDAYAVRLWQSPYTEELVLQIGVGVGLIAFGWYLAARRTKPPAKSAREAIGAPQAFLAGAGLTIAGLPGAVPYLAAIDLVLRAELQLAQRVWLIAYYNIAFAAPIVAIVGLRLAFGRRGDALLETIRGFLDRWGSRLIVWLLVILGVVLVLDGLGWFVGYPLIPV